MSVKTLPAHRKLQPAKRGDKKGWPTVSGQVPPKVFERLEAVIAASGKARTDAVREAVELYLDRAA